MSYKSVLHSNRVFIDPGNTNITSNLTVAIPAITNISLITVDSTLDYTSEGYLTIGTEQFYYTAKTPNTFTGITRAVNGTSADSHIVPTPPSYTSAVQYHPVPTDIPQTANLAGWYTDGYSNQASLRVFNAPVIQPGVIRYVPDDGVNNAMFQGCTDVTPSGPTWVEFNALQGLQGNNGIINTLLVFENVENTLLPTANIGEIIKTTSVSVVNSGVTPNIEVRTIISGNTTINGIKSDVMEITQTANAIILTPQGLPHTWNLNNTIGNLKSSDANNVRYAYGTLGTFKVENSVSLYAGLVAVSYLNSSSELCVKPFNYLSTAQLDPNYLVAPVDLGIVGICCNTPSSGANAIILMDGIGQVKISTDNTPYIPVTQSSYNNSGRQCYINAHGYGINLNSTVLPPYCVLGTFLEGKAGYSLNNGDFALIKLNQHVTLA